MGELRVHFLGSGDAFCACGRHQAGYLVRGEPGNILLDCGVTTLASLKRDGIPTDCLDTIILSHLHGDHFAGLPFLFLEYTHVECRRRPLCIAGPPGTESRVAELFRTMYADAGTQPLPFPLEFVELHPRRPAGIGPAEIYPFRVPHQEKEISLGVRLRFEGRSIMYSGDTGWTDDLLLESCNTDLTISECCFFETRIPSHLDYPRLAENRHRFETRRLVLTHLGREVHAHQRDLEIETATDGMQIPL